MFLLLGLVLLLLLPSPWSVIALGVCLALGLAELLFWRRRVGGLRVQSGPDTLIGKTARVTVACHPAGQVAVEGELWSARCAGGGADADQLVTIVGRDHLVLLVEAAKSSPT